MLNNIILIGFMGSGKSRLAKDFSKKIGINIIDTDNIIESIEKKEIKDIFSENGEQYFRDMEQLVANWIQDDLKNTLISSGGGFHKVININQLGRVVFIDSSFENILKHLEKKSEFSKRPLYTDKKSLKELYDKRRIEYIQAAYETIKVDLYTDEENINRLLEIHEYDIIQKKEDN